MPMSLRILVTALVALATGVTAGAQRSAFRPVTDAILQTPDPGDWINYRRTQDAWGYSPLDQINTRNVGQLQLAWSWMIGPGISEPTPLVYQGTMYLPHPNGRVQALDAATGELLWDFERETPAVGYGIMRSLAIYEDKIFVPTRDAHLLALEAKTGTLAWDRPIADSTLGYHFTSGPLVVKGKVIVGMQGCQIFKNDVCFISAYDAQKGTEVWRTSTIARPGEPGGDTWGDLPLMFRAGGDAWITGSYDPSLNLVYWSTAQAKPWARFQRADPEGKELYTNSTLALDPDTGKIAWYRQLIPGDSFDMDEVYENVLVDDEGRRSLFKMGKLGILWQIDRKTGAFVAAHDLGYQNIYDLNSRTGELTFKAGRPQHPNTEVDFCPGVIGLKNWQAMAYHPMTRAMYVPLQVSCERSTFREVERREGGGGVGAGQGRKEYVHPATGGQMGDFLAMHVSGKILWRHRRTTPFTSAALTTAGGLVVTGDYDRWLYIFDSASGDVLFQTRMPTAVQGFPITYAVNGTQYLAVPVGAGSPRVVFAARVLTDRTRPPIGNALFVFALPDRPATSRQQVLR
jgi:alcohol dehydrogenase (cytochrome c)